MDSTFERIRRINDSDVLAVFTPSKPVSSSNLFCGRVLEIERIAEALNTDGMHVLLYGDRGVGKTSLARQASKMMTEIKGGRFYTKQCSSSDTFESIIEAFLCELGFEDKVSLIKKENAAIGIKAVGAGVDRQSEINVVYEPSNPSWAAKRIQDQNCILIIDEFDTLKSVDDKDKVAQFIKQLSDLDSKVKVIVVGIAFSAKDLLSGHASISRCLSEVYLDRMSESELLQIITSGEDRLSIKFHGDIKDKIVKSSNGFPYYVHLLSLYSAIEAIVKEEHFVTKDDFEAGLSHALSNIDISLKDMYQFAVGDRNNLQKKQVLYALATAKTQEISIDMMKSLYANEFGVSKPETVTLVGLLKKAMSHNTVLRKCRRGIYSFANPLMPPYILLLGKP